MHKELGVRHAFFFAGIHWEFRQTVIWMIKHVKSPEGISYKPMANLINIGVRGYMAIVVGDI